jgi:hypothetical protein
VAKHPGKNTPGTLWHTTHILLYAVLKRGGTASSQELLDYLKHCLPEPAVPHLVFVLDSIPLSPNGKADIYALLQLHSDERGAGEIYVLPREVLALRLGQIWQKLLGFHFMP